MVKSNGVKIGDYALSRIKHNINSELAKVWYGCNERDTFWIELVKKTDTPWIKTFFSFIDIWANQSYSWIDVRLRNKRCKIQILTKDKSFFDSIESFSKIPEIQTLAKEHYEDFNNASFKKLYDSLNASSKELNKSASDPRYDAIYISFKDCKIDNWFLSNFKTDLSESYFESKKLLDKIGDYIICCKNGLKDQFKYVFETYRGVIGSFQIKEIKYLIEVGYEPYRLMDYLFRDIYNQGLDLNFSNAWRTDSALQILRDYVSMNVDMKKDYEKYPKYLSTFHDVTLKNFEVMEDNILNEKFNNVVNLMKNQKFEYSDKDYIIILPKNVQDLIDEGQNLSHCVASYYKRMANDETRIVFLRKKDCINQSLVTIEIRENNIVQAKSKNNSKPKEKEKKFIENYIKYMSNLCN
jgi:hypothetical protein